MRQVDSVERRLTNGRKSREQCKHGQRHHARHDSDHLVGTVEVVPPIELDWELPAAVRRSAVHLTGGLNALDHHRAVIVWKYGTATPELPWQN